MKNRNVNANASIYIDSRASSKGHSIKVKVTFKGKRRYYKTKHSMSVEDFDKLMNAKRRNSQQKEVYDDLNYQVQKANQIIKDLTVFTFDNFEELYLSKTKAYNDLNAAFDRYIVELKQEDRVGTASSYECAKNSLDTFQKNLTFAEITPSLLKKYERWMISNGNSTTTVGIYLRSLRTVYNLQKIDKSLYPFGEGSGQYSIPTGRNIKKALSMDEVSSIFNFEAEPNSKMEMARDYWIFLFLCNGMNVKDLCLLKWKSIDENILTYTRSKTKTTKKDQKTIEVSLKPETMQIIKKWGQPSLDKEAFIFPHLEKGMSAERQRAVYQQLTKTINKYMGKISTELKIGKPCTTYYARHSFATILKRSGTQIEMISELLGHSSVSVTESYLSSFEHEQIHRATDVLTSGFKTAN